MASAMDERRRALAAAAKAAAQRYQSLKGQNLARGAMSSANSNTRQGAGGLSSMQAQPRMTNPASSMTSGGAVDPLRRSSAAIQSRIDRNAAAANFKSARQLGNRANQVFDNNMAGLRGIGGGAHDTKMAAIQQVQMQRESQVMAGQNAVNEATALKAQVDGMKNPNRGFDAQYGYQNQASIDKGKRAISPLTGRITSRYGPRTLGGAKSNHAGMDIAGRGAVRASYGGVVVAVVGGRKRGQIGGTQLAPGRTGNGVIIRHSDGTYALYGHVAPGKVKVGQQVPQGYVLGQTDLSGRTTGYHLHFEYWRANKSTMNPAGLW